MGLVSTSDPNENCRQPTHPPEGESKTTESGTRTQSLALTNTPLYRIEGKKCTRKPDAANNNQESKKKQKKTPE